MILALFSSLVSSICYLPHEEKTFLTWMRRTNQFFTGDEYHLRFGIFLTNLRLVQQHNSSPHKFTVTLNQYSCYTPTEYRIMLGYKPTTQKSKPPTPLKKLTKQSLSFDWRMKGVVNDIKNQGNCGACWAFSVVQAVESIDSIAIGCTNLLRFSEQSLIDCNFDSIGCDGGNPYVAMAYIASEQDGKFNLEQDYPYKGVAGDCLFDNYEKVGSLSDYIRISEGDEDELAQQIELRGPASVCIDAASWSFQLYNGGIYDEKACSPLMLNHAVGCVGFGVEGETKYWIVRNSWGKSWGEDGYMRMIWENNQCGIASMAIIPIP